MDNKRLFLILLCVSVGVVLLFGIWKLTLSKPEQTPVETSKNYTSTEVSQHSTEKDCWTIIAGNVYDITKYIPSHPGGDGILAACGQDGTALFTERTNSSGESIGSGTPHSNNATQQLERLKIGTLKN